MATNTRMGTTATAVATGVCSTRREVPRAIALVLTLVTKIALRAVNSYIFPITSAGTTLDRRSIVSRCYRRSKSFRTFLLPVR